MGVNEVHGLDHGALRLLALRRGLAFLSNQRVVDHLADSEAVRSAGAFLDLWFWAGWPLSGVFSGTVLDLFVLVVDEVPLFLMGFLVLVMMRTIGGLALVLVIINLLLHTAGDTQCTLGVPDIITELLDFLRNLILCVFDGFLLLCQLFLLFVQLLCLLLNLFRLVNLLLLAILLFLMSQ